MKLYQGINEPLLQKDWCKDPANFFMTTPRSPLWAWHLPFRKVSSFSTVNCDDPFKHTALSRHCLQSKRWMQWNSCRDQATQLPSLYWIMHIFKATTICTVRTYVIWSNHRKELEARNHSIHSNKSIKPIKKEQKQKKQRVEQWELQVYFLIDDWQRSMGNTVAMWGISWRTMDVQRDSPASTRFACANLPWWASQKATDSCARTRDAVPGIATQGRVASMMCVSDGRTCGQTTSAKKFDL